MCHRTRQAQRRTCIRAAHRAPRTGCRIGAGSLVFLGMRSTSNLPEHVANGGNHRFRRIVRDRAACFYDDLSSPRGQTYPLWLDLVERRESGTHPPRPGGAGSVREARCVATAIDNIAGARKPRKKHRTQYGNSMEYARDCACVEPPKLKSRPMVRKVVLHTQVVVALTSGISRARLPARRLHAVVRPHRPAECRRSALVVVVRLDS
jgi:hypothetical protein